MMAATPLVGAATNVVMSEAQAFAQDPLGYLAGWCLKLGAVLLGVGTVMGIAGYVLTGYGQKAWQDAASEAAIIAGGFGNVKYDPSNSPMLPVTTSNPVQDLSNFGNDVVRTFQNAGSDLTAGFSALATALGDIPKVFLMAISHGPAILWDAFISINATASGDLMTFLFPWLIILGFSLVILGLVFKLAKWTISALKPELTLISESVQARLLAPIRRPINAWNEKLKAGVAKAPPSIAVTATLPPPSGLQGLSTPAVASRVEMEPTPATSNVAGEPTPTSEVEEMLGDTYPQSKDRMRAALATG